MLKPKFFVKPVPQAPQNTPPVKVTAGISRGASLRIPPVDPELDELYTGSAPIKRIPNQVVSSPRVETPIPGYIPPVGYSPTGEKLSEIAGLFADPMSEEDVANLARRKKRVPHKFLKKAKVCVNCKHFNHYKRGSDGAHMNLCTFHAGVPWDKSWTCSYSYCENFEDKESSEKLPISEKKDDIESAEFSVP